MPKRPSPIPVSPLSTMWFVAKAIRSSGGTAGNPIDSDADDFLNSGDPGLAASLSTLQLGLFAAGSQTVFDQFFIRLVATMDDLLRQANWLPTGGSATSTAGWKIDTTLGSMADDLVNEFGDKVEWTVPHPAHP